jgi:hypothetical protein
VSALLTGVCISGGDKVTELEREFERELENLVDKTSLKRVLDTLASVCNGKAEHLEANWQDTYAAKVWARMARKLNGLAAKSEV